jgi:hypothetical protein
MRKNITFTAQKSQEKKRKRTVNPCCEDVRIMNEENMKNYKAIFLLFVVFMIGCLVIAFFNHSAGFFQMAMISGALGIMYLQKEILLFYKR